MHLFGQFVGDWEFRDWWREGQPSNAMPFVGESHWRWILGGRGVQDTFGHIEPTTGRFVPAGTTVRFYDPKIKAWRSTWNSPPQHAVRRFIGRARGTDIVLRELDRGWRGERWIFADIRRDSFSWRAEGRAKPERKFRVVERMTVRRIQRPLAGRAPNLP